MASPLDDASDALLAGRAADGDTRAFEVLVRRYGRLMRSYAARLLGSNNEVDDVVQEAFVTAWRQLPALADPTAVKSWLMRIVSRKSIDRIRARRDEAELKEWDATVPERQSPHERAELRSQLDAVAATLNALPALQRQCWILKEVGGYSYREIADELEVPPATVRGGLARARQALLRGMEVWR